MFVHVTQPLFAWEALEDNPSLKSIKALVDAIPDGKLIESLEQARGRGRNDYPVHVLWGRAGAYRGRALSQHRGVSGRVGAQRRLAPAHRH